MPNKNKKQEGKFIIIIRDPKDTLVSGKYYWPETVMVRWLYDDRNKFNKRSKSKYLLFNDENRSKFIPYNESHYQKYFDINTAYDWFISGMLPFGDYWQFYSDYYFLLKYIVKDVNKQVLWLYYEDLITDKKQSIIKIINFLGLSEMLNNNNNINININSDEIIENIINETSTKGMRKIIGDDKKQLYSPYFVRKGISGDWKNHLTQYQARMIDNITKNRFAGTTIGHKAWYSDSSSSNSSNSDNTTQSKL